MVSPAHCKGKRPPATEADCKPCATFCDNQDCSGHGTCAMGVCTCQDGWGGPYCDVDTSRCSSGKRDTAGLCCKSGVVDKDGNCCKAQDSDTPPVRNWDGSCCAAGFVDNCGRCIPKSEATECRLDIAGTCCEEVRHLAVPACALLLPLLC